MKKFISIIFAAVLAITMSGNAFAYDNGLRVAVDELNEYTNSCEDYYIFYDRMYPTLLPIWSNDSTNRMESVIKEERERTYNNIDDVTDQRNRIDSVISGMCVSETELEFMINLFEKEDNSSKYYDDDTWNSFLSVLNNGKLALESKDEESIYQAYICMRNEYNNICLYNKTMGDVNNDGVVNTKDVTTLQKAINERITLTSSQMYVSYVYFHNTSIIKPNTKTVTSMQKYITELSFDGSFSDVNLKELDKYKVINPAERHFGMLQENANLIYSYYMTQSRQNNLYA